MNINNTEHRHGVKGIKTYPSKVFGSDYIIGTSEIRLKKVKCNRKSK